MERRELVGALAAIFCGVLLPEPVRETIRIASFNDIIALGSPDSADAYLHSFGGDGDKIWTWDTPLSPAQLLDRPQVYINRCYTRILDIDMEKKIITTDTT